VAPYLAQHRGTKIGARAIKVILAAILGAASRYWRHTWRNISNLAPYLAQHLVIGAILGHTISYLAPQLAPYLVLRATLGALSCTWSHTGRHIMYLALHWAQHLVLGATLGAISRTSRHTGLNISYFAPHWAHYLVLHTTLGIMSGACSLVDWHHTWHLHNLHSTLLPRSVCHHWLNAYSQ
jgi:hypothetical protein